MGRKPWATFLWPGLPQLWTKGSWSALVVAFGFATLVNFALAATLLWNELLPPPLRMLSWVAVVAIWGGAAIFSYRSDGPEPAGQRAEPEGDTFPAAVDRYLNGDWYDAEQILRGLLRHDPQDGDAGLMLATLLRHMGRLDEATRQLDRLDGCRKWELEIHSERQLLSEARQDEEACLPQSADLEQADAMAEAA